MAIIEDYMHLPWGWKHHAFKCVFIWIMSQFATSCSVMAESTCEWMTTDSWSVHVLVRRVVPACDHEPPRNLLWVPLNWEVCIYTFCWLMLHLPCMIKVKIMRGKCLIPLLAANVHVTQTSGRQWWLKEREICTMLTWASLLSSMWEPRLLVNCVEMVILIQWPYQEHSGQLL